MYNFKCKLRREGNPSRTHKMEHYQGNESEGVAVPLKAGSVVLHHGATVHYSRGNSTKGQRRAMIVNLRPRKMIDFERARGFDHTGENKVRNNA